MKLKEDEEAAARVYESFVASFDVDEKNSKTFIRSSSGSSSTHNEGGERGGSSSGNNSGKSGELYKLSSSSNKDKPSSDSPLEVDSLMLEIMASISLSMTAFCVFYRSICTIHSLAQSLIYCELSIDPTSYYMFLIHRIKKRSYLLPPLQLLLLQALRSDKLIISWTNS